MRPNSYSAEEDAIIRDFWNKPGAIREFQHLLPGRSRQAIEKRGQKLQLGARPRTWWTEEQDAALRKIWHSGESIKRNMDRFGEHSYAALVTRANMLGLGKRAVSLRGQSPIAWPLMERELRRGPADRFRLAEKVGIDGSTAHKHINRARKAGLVHITNWIRPNGKFIPVYRLGAGTDMPKPRPSTDAEYQRQRNARQTQLRVQRGETVRGVNPFATLIHQVAA
ncbi:hypothetical protein [Caballeronia zhejiangensis]|uniref:hypothetical protein n=1 Tax=Caballeronia zhejiangensis TaxID=871203 RepID=UPI00158E50B8|nr:hypothetical protein [Caballeronia zhejiangensis]